MTKTKANKILWGMIILYVLVLGTVGVMRHYNFQTQTWDMGAFVQTFWNTAQGRVMFNNLEEAANHLGVHMSPWLFILLPGYFIFQTPYYLLIVQVAALALGALPLYLLARKVLGNSKWALLIAAGYLLYPSLHWVNLFDFHSVSFIIPLLLTGFYLIEERRWLWAAVFLILAASTKENAILVVLFTGIYLMIKKSFDGWWTKERKVGLITAVLAIGYFIFSVKVLMPALGGGLLRFDRYENLGATPAEAVVNMVQNPGLILQTTLTFRKLFYLLWLFLPVAFLPLLSWRTLLLLVPGLAQNLLTNFDFQFSSSFQYDSILIAGVWVGAIYGLDVFLKKWPGKQRALQYIFVLTVAAGFLFRSPISLLHFPTALFADNPRWNAFREMVKLVPDGVSLAAQTNLVPHLSHRKHAHMLGREPFAMDMVLLDARDSFGFPDAVSFQNYIDSYLDSGLYEVVYLKDERYVIIARKDLVE